MLEISAIAEDKFNENRFTMVLMYSRECVIQLGKFGMLHNARMGKRGCTAHTRYNMVIFLSGWQDRLNLNNAHCMCQVNNS